MSCGDIFLGLIAILFPPLAVWVKTGLCTVDSLINIMLCCLGYLPGLLHAWYIIAKYPEYDYEVIPDQEAGSRVTYYVVDGQTAGRAAPAGTRSYGTQGPSKNAQEQQQRIAQNARDSAVGSSSRPSTDAPPPTYDDATRPKGDNKIQSRG